jgi:hypothetical protein
MKALPGKGRESRKKRYYLIGDVELTPEHKLWIYVFHQGISDLKRDIRRFNYNSNSYLAAKCVRWTYFELTNDYLMQIIELMGLNRSLMIKRIDRIMKRCKKNVLDESVMCEIYKRSDEL